MEKEQREFIEVENLNGDIEKIEIIAEVNSERDDKHYILFTTDEILGDEVNIGVAYITIEEGKNILNLVEAEDEINYVYSLINTILMEDE